MDSVLIFHWLHIMGWLLAGAVIGIFCINPFLAILLFDLPLAFKYWRKGYFQVNTPFMVYSLGLAFFALLGFLGLQLALTYAQRLWGYCIVGMLFCVSIALLDLTFNPRNRQDFIQDNQAYLSPLGVYHLLERDRQGNAQSAEKKAPVQRHKSNALLRLLKRYLAFRLKLGSWIIVVE